MHLSSEQKKQMIVESHKMGFMNFLEEIEKELILYAMSGCGNNRSNAAKLLRVGRTTLVEKCRRLGIL